MYMSGPPECAERLKFEDKNAPAPPRRIAAAGGVGVAVPCDESITEATRNNTEGNA